jgi:hypothetical protein
MKRKKTAGRGRFQVMKRTNARNNLEPAKTTGQYYVLQVIVNNRRQKLRFEYNTSMKEVRLLRRYTGHVDRFVGTAQDYKWSNPLEALAGAGHIVSSGAGTDPLFRQILGTADGSIKEDGGVANYEGIFGYGGKTVENVKSVASIFRGKFGKAVGGLINVLPDAASDILDGVAGVRHGEQYHTAA